MDIGKAMKEVRERAGLSRSEVAKELNVRPQTIWKIEKGKSWPKPETIEKFCEVAKVPLAYFYAKAMTREDYTVK